MELKQDFRGLFLNMSMKISIFDFFNPLLQTRHVWSIYKIDTRLFTHFKSLEFQP